MEQLGQFLPLVLIVGIFYFLLIRPQQRRMRQHQALVGSVSTGDDIVTVGGMYGTVDRIEEETILLRLEDGALVRLAKSAIGRKLASEAGKESSPEE